jgi:DNA-binding NarL/FixJ family response regulator
MRRIVFIDDDKTELDEFGRIVGGKYQYTQIHWPGEAERLFNGVSPDIFVSDLYLPSRSGDSVPTDTQKNAAAKAANELADQFSRLYADPNADDKARLKATMKAISSAFDMLELQWKALGQHPDNGIALLTQLKAEHPSIPIVFYSRKITPRDVIRVLQAGAVDAIQKGTLAPQEVLTRLENAQEFWHRENLQQLWTQGLNVNVTLISGK